MISLLDGLVEERDALLLAKTVAGPSDKAKIDKRVSIIELQIIELIKVDDFQLIEEAKQDDKFVIDGFTKTIADIQGRRDDLLTLREDCRVMEAIGWK